MEVNVGMIKRIVVSLCAVASLGLAAAQETFTARLQRWEAGQGIVVLHHDADIDALVNGLATVAHPITPTKPSRDEATIVPPKQADVTTETTTTPTQGGKKVRMNGFRIQVYVGGNSRDAKYKAEQMESKVRSYFPEVDIYTRFVSPKWICHVGDFKTRDEAVEFLSELREKGGFGDAIVVPCKINAYTY